MTRLRSGSYRRMLLRIGDRGKIALVFTLAVFFFLFIVNNCRSEQSPTKRSRDAKFHTSPIRKGQKTSTKSNPIHRSIPHRTETSSPLSNLEFTESSTTDSEPIQVELSSVSSNEIKNFSHIYNSSTVAEDYSAESAEYEFSTTGHRALFSDREIIDYLVQFGYLNTSVKLWPTRKVMARDLDSKMELRLVTKPSGKICDFGPDDLSVAFFLKSSAEEFDVRSDVRSSWVTDLRKQDIAAWEVFFVVGMSQHNSINAALREESEIFEDIFIVNFFDDYKNLTLKAYSMLLLESRFCSRADWIFNGDTDSLVLVPNLLRFLAKPRTASGRRLTENAIIGSCHYHAMPERRKGAKWYVSYENWPLEHYPYYCSGNHYIMPHGVPYQLLTCAPSIKSFQNIINEDVAVTGVLAACASVRRMDDQERFVLPADDRRQFTRIRWNSRMISVHLHEGTRVKPWWRGYKKAIRNGQIRRNQRL